MALLARVPHAALRVRGSPSAVHLLQPAADIALILAGAMPRTQVDLAVVDLVAATHELLLRRGSGCGVIEHVENRFGLRLRRLGCASREARENRERGQNSKRS